jgi:hypothetical protein
MTIFRLLRCGNNNSAIDERASTPGCFGNPHHVVEYYDQYERFSSNPEDDDDNNDDVMVPINIHKKQHQQQTTRRRSGEKSELDKLIDMIEASETANETETDEEEEEEEDWDMCHLVGESLLTNYSPDTVDTRDALYGKAVVLLYFGDGDTNTLEMLKLFDAGYHHSVLSIVYCHDDLSAFVDMPARWFAAQNVAELSANMDVTEEPCLMVIDPESGDVLSENALCDILQLDVSNAAAYDEQATRLFQSWTHHMPIEQSVIGEMTIELPDGFGTQIGLEETSNMVPKAGSRAVIV